MHINFFAHIDHALKELNDNCQPQSLKLNFFPIPKSPTRIGFISVKIEVENLTLGHL
jgi:hypothetical protein